MACFWQGQRVQELNLVRHVIGESRRANNEDLGDNGIGWMQKGRSVGGDRREPPPWTLDSGLLSKDIWKVGERVAGRRRIPNGFRGTGQKDQRDAGATIRLGRDCLRVGART